MNEAHVAKPWPDKSDKSMLDTRRSVASHCHVVGTVLGLLARELLKRAAVHDRTKRMYIVKWHVQLDYYRRTGRWEAGWMEGEHAKAERHHLDASVPPKVDLLDVIEYAVDCAVSNALDDSGPRELKLDCNILEQALLNTGDTVLSMLPENRYEEK